MMNNFIGIVAIIYSIIMTYITIDIFWGKQNGFKR